MDSEALSTFLAVFEEGGVSAAAQKLGRTQSAISRRLSLLEGQLGVPLFERIGKTLVLSGAGAELLPHARRVTAAVADAAMAMRALSETGGRLRFICVGTLADSGLADHLAWLRRAHPDCDVRLQTATSDEVSDLVLRGKADIGLRYHDDASPELETHIAWHESLIVVCSPDHPHAGALVNSLSALARERWLAFPSDADRREVYAATIFALFQVHGISAPDWLPVDSLTAQKRLVEAGFGIALLQESAVEEELSRGDIARIDVRELNARMPVVLVRRKNGYLSKAGEEMWERLKSEPR